MEKVFVENYAVFHNENDNTFLQIPLKKEEIENGIGKMAYYVKDLLYTICIDKNTGTKKFLLYSKKNNNLLCRGEADIKQKAFISKNRSTNYVDSIDEITDDVINASVNVEIEGLITKLHITYNENCVLAGLAYIEFDPNHHYEVHSDDTLDKIIDRVKQDYEDKIKMLTKNKRKR